MSDVQEENWATSKMAELLKDKNAANMPKVGDLVEGKIISISKNEIYLDIDGLTTGVIRGREIYDESEDSDKLKISDIASATVVDLENENGYMELSFREAGHQKAWGRLEKLYKAGELVESRVTDANKGGLMIKIGNVMGFLPVSQLTTEHYPRIEGGDKSKILSHLKSFINQNLRTKIIDLNEKEEKLIVSEKAAWDEKQKAAVSKFKIGDRVHGIITGVVDFGAFVEFDNNLEGLVHISELAWQRIDDPRDIVKVGDKVEAEIIEIDDTKISLSLKKLQADPWSQVEKKYKIGQKIKAKVLKVNPFGVFVELDQDIHGLVHISELSDKKVANPQDLIKIGETYEFVILTIEPKEHRLGLSLKAINQPAEKKVKEEKPKVEKKAKSEKVEKINVTGDKLNIILKDKSEKQSTKEAGESLSNLLKNYGVEANKLNALNIEVGKDPNSGIMFSSILPFLIPALFILGLIWFMMRQVSGVNNRAMSFGQSGAKMADQEKIKVTFKDVAGAIEAKNDLEEIVEFLKSPQKFIALGAKIPKGVLLLGSPGTGKTLLSRAVAGEAKVPFFHISGSEFVEMFVGVGASRVRDLFKKAKKASPCIIFIDEIDAVGRQRGTGLGGSHDEREQTLNQILTEMDGFETDENVIVIAATNRPDVLDPALLRPGRFDRRVVLSLPDIAEREEILAVHAKNKLFIKDVKLKTIAQRTIGFSGADLMNLLNEAAISAARYNRKKISVEDCLESIDKVLLGPQRKSAKFSEKEKEITAYHEAGHALIAHLLPDSDPVHKISIIPRGHAGGFTMKLPDEDRRMHSHKQMLADIAVSLGGHAAELKQFNDITTGASSDLENATKLARGIVTRYGMSTKLGPRTFGNTSEMIFLGKEIHEQRDYSEETAQAIDREINAIIETEYEKVKALINKNQDKLTAIAKKLLEVETIERAEFEALFEEEPKTATA